MTAHAHVRRLLQDWTNARAGLRALEEAEHPPMTDHYGRVWTWSAGDTYIHDGLMAWTREMILRQDAGLPSPELAGNPNYAGLCAICRSNWPAS